MPDNIDPGLYLFASQANAELDARRREYVQLLLRYDAALAKYDDLALAYDLLQERYRQTAEALSRTLEVLANVSKTMENKNVLDDLRQSPPQWAM